MKNKFLLASVTFLSVVSLFACTSPKKESNKSSAPSSSTNVAKETTKSGSKVREEISDMIRVSQKRNELDQQIKGMSIFQVTG